jgi:hypothetical protein
MFFHWINTLVMLPFGNKGLKGFGCQSPDGIADCYSIENNALIPDKVPSHRKGFLCTPSHILLNAIIFQ